MDEFSTKQIASGKSLKHFVFVNNSGEPKREIPKFSFNSCAIWITESSLDAYIPYYTKYIYILQILWYAIFLNFFSNLPPTRETMTSLCIIHTDSFLPTPVAEKTSNHDLVATNRLTGVPSIRGGPKLANFCNQSITPLMSLVSNIFIVK